MGCCYSQNSLKKQFEENDRNLEKDLLNFFLIMKGYKKFKIIKFNLFDAQFLLVKPQKYIIKHQDRYQISNKDLKIGNSFIEFNNQQMQLPEMTFERFLEKKIKLRCDYFNDAFHLDKNQNKIYKKQILKYNEESESKESLRMKFSLLKFLKKKPKSLKNKNGKYDILTIGKESILLNLENYTISKIALIYIFAEIIFINTNDFSFCKIDYNGNLQVKFVDFPKLNCVGQKKVLVLKDGNFNFDVGILNEFKSDFLLSDRILLNNFKHSEIRFDNLYLLDFLNSRISKEYKIFIEYLNEAKDYEPASLPAEFKVDYSSFFI